MSASWPARSRTSQLIGLPSEGDLVDPECAQECVAAKVCRDENHSDSSNADRALARSVRAAVSGQKEAVLALERENTKAQEAAFTERLEKIQLLRQRSTLPSQKTLNLPSHLLGTTLPRP